MSACPVCLQPALTTPDGRQLNPKRSRFGRYWRDGSTATATHIRQGFLTYSEHHCTGPPPPPKPTQDALF